MRIWTPEEDAILTDLYKQFSAGEIAARMARSRPSIKNRVIHLGLKKPDGITNPGRFAPGHASWNKGLRGVTCGGVATQFKPGNRSGRALDVYQPVGTERISRDGYLERKINDDMPLHRRWRAVHLVEWEAVNGPLPEGHCLVFVNGDKTDRRLENLQCITRRELMMRNTVHNYPPELRQVIRLKGAITKRITTRTRKEKPA